MGKFNNIEQTDVPLTSLNTAYIVSVQFGHLRQFLLGQTQTKSKFANALAEENTWVWTGHVQIMRI